MKAEDYFIERVKKILKDEDGWEVVDKYNMRYKTLSNNLLTFSLKEYKTRSGEIDSISCWFNVKEENTKEYYSYFFTNTNNNNYSDILETAICLLKKKYESFTTKEESKTISIIDKLLGQI